MEKKDFESLIQGKLFCIPDYQRGYAWAEKQWGDFVTDIDALIEEDVQNHYTGTIVVFEQPNRQSQKYGLDKLKVFDVVDGQQRLTTSILYLSIILNKLIKNGNEGYKQKIPIYLFEGSTCKLTLNNETSSYFLDLVSKGMSNTDISNMHQKRLSDAYTYLSNHISEQCKKKGQDSNDYLSELYGAIVRKLNFTFYTITDESEIGMTFELMNSRGQSLSILELLKNYLMHWISRNENDETEKENLIQTVNKAWKEVYVNLSKSNGNEDQCLKIAWILYCKHTPKHWNGYEGFKELDVIPLRYFEQRSKKEVKEFIKLFTNGLAEISKHYAIITKPNIDDCSNETEYSWLTKIRHAGNIANFLPIMTASRIKFYTGKISFDQYINLLKALEKYAFRVYLWEKKRSNSGMSSLYRWAKEVFDNTHNFDCFPTWIIGLINWYSNKEDFANSIETPSNWYHQNKGALKYTLFEYELILLEEEGKGKKANLKWSDLSDATLEHILPQTIEVNSEWSKAWSDENIEFYLHDIGNIVLTENNSNYKNFSFERKKGISGVGYCYANSDIRQERKISKYAKWEVEECKDRHRELSKFIVSRWGSEIDNIEIEKEDDEYEEK